MQKQDDLKVYAIFDKKSQMYDTPFFAISDLFAKRRYLLMSEENGPLKKWPEDFQLHRLGAFSQNNGELSQDTEIIFETTQR